MVQTLIKQGAHTKPRPCQYLTHAHSHITRAVAAMGNCFALFGAHYHGITVGSMNGENSRLEDHFTAEATPLNASSTQHNTFYRVVFLCGGNKKFPTSKWDSYRLWCKWISTGRLVEEVISTGLTNTHTARGFCISCSLENNAFSWVTALRTCQCKADGGGGEEAGHGVGIWHFSKIFRQIPCLRAKHSSQMQPNFPTPGCTLLPNILRQNPRQA